MSWRGRRDVLELDDFLSVHTHEVGMVEKITSRYRYETFGEILRF